VNIRRDSGNIRRDSRNSQPDSRKAHFAHTHAVGVAAQTICSHNVTDVSMLEN
jgi:hypothetical protein